MSAGWKLPSEERARLLALYPPRYANFVADRVTLPGGAAPPRAAFRIIGRAHDGRGVEAMVVERDGWSERPDGGRYHITWSLSEGRDAKESNDVIAAGDWQAFDGEGVIAHPARW